MITKGSVTSLFDSWIKNKAVIKDIIGKIGEFKYELCMLNKYCIRVKFLWCGNGMVIWRLLCTQEIHVEVFRSEVF